MQKLSKKTIDATGFNKIQSNLSSLANSESNKNYFKNIIPNKNLKQLTEHISLSDIIYQELIKRKNIDISVLGNMYDILSKIKIEGSFLSEAEFQRLHNTLEINFKLENILSNSVFKSWKKLQTIKTNKKWIKLIEQKFDENFQIKINASKELFKLFEQKKLIEKKIEKKMAEHYENSKKKKWLQNENISWINERSVLPFKVSLKNKIQGIIHQHSSSGKTAFIEPLDIVKLNNTKNQNEFDIHIEKKKILLELTSFFNQISKKIESIYNFINKYDRHLTIAKYASETNSTKPNFNSESNMKIKNSINPFLKDKTNPIPLNFEMDSNTNIYIISGPNTGGKTVVLKSIGLYTIMAQSGIFIPSDYFEIPFFDNVLTDIGDNQSIEEGLSTFSSHIMNIKQIIEVCTPNSLVLLDEIGTGTDPNSSMAIAQAILEKFNSKKMKLITTTHLINLKDWASRTKHVENGMMKFDKKKFSPTYEFISGIPGSSYAIEILQKMSLDHKIINRSKSLMGTKAAKLDQLISSIEKNESQSKQMNKIIKLKLDEVELKQKQISDTQKKIAEEKNQIEANFGLQANKYLEETKKRVERIVQKIRSDNASKESIINAKKVISSEIEKSTKKISINKKIPHNSINKNEIIIGKQYLINSLNLIGVIESDIDSDQKVFLNVDGKRIKINYLELRNVSKKNTTQNKKLHSKFEVSNISSNKIDLRGFNVEDATNELDKIIDSAYLNNIVYIKILHGTGTGALQDGIHKYLKEHKNVKTYNFASLESGGYGVTEITLI